MTRRHPRPTLFPYTTLFRSNGNTKFENDETFLVNLATPTAATLFPTASSGTGTIRKDRKSTRLNSSHVAISYAVFCLKKKRVKITVVGTVWHRVGVWRWDRR